MIPSLMFTIFLGTQLISFPDQFLPTWITLFKEYPILYEGTPEGVKDKFKELSQEPHSSIIIGHTNEQTITGLVYGAPLKIYPAYEKLFQENDMDLSSFYHIKDLIIVPEYRKQGIGTSLYNNLEKQIKEWGYSKISLCVIEHGEHHPLKPVTSYDPKLFWSKQGFCPTSMVVKKSWPTLMDDKGTIKTYEHTLRFWVKEL